MASESGGGTAIGSGSHKEPAGPGSDCSDSEESETEPEEQLACPACPATCLAGDSGDGKQDSSSEVADLDMGVGMCTVSHQRIETRSPTRRWPTDGPRSLDGMMSWPTQFLQKFEEVNLTMHLVAATARGVNLVSDYSGIGSFEQCCHQLREAMVAMGIPVLRGFKSVRASDCARAPSQVLLSHKQGPEKPCHIFGDIMLRVPEAVRHELQRILKHYRQVYLEALASGHAAKELQTGLGREMVKAMQERLEQCAVATAMHCSVHGDDCELNGSDDRYEGDINFWCAGTTCTDFSTANQKALGVFGDHMLPLAVWCQCARNAAPDLIIHECTPRFPVWVLMLWFGDQFNVLSRTWCPTDSGIPARRKRLYTLIVNQAQECMKMNVSHSINGERNQAAWGVIHKASPMRSHPSVPAEPPPLLCFSMIRRGGTRLTVIFISERQPWLTLHLRMDTRVMASSSSSSGTSRQMRRASCGRNRAMPHSHD